MILQSIEGSELAIPFKGAFKHASAERHAMQSLWVTVTDANGERGYGEGCPREYVTGESISSALAFVERHQADWMANIQDVRTLRHWVEKREIEIDAHPAAWAAVELAFLDLFGKLQHVPVERILEVAELRGRFQYTAVIGDGPLEQFAAQLRQFLRAGFKAFKIKLAPDMQANREKVKALLDAGIAGGAVRADANNLWRDPKTCVADLQSLQFQFVALEEPLQPGEFNGMAHIATALRTSIILDESVSQLDHLVQIPSPPRQWIINCRVSKMGGLLRSLELLQALEGRGFGVIVGAHVGETSVLTRAALTLAQVAGDRLIAQEGAFGTHLLVRDVAEPPLMFGAGGVIDLTQSDLASRPGLGLNVPGKAPL
jgi:L-alanine-DL-glutamate epimerase-like enolase superfamily enzyme